MIRKRRKAPNKPPLIFYIFVLGVVYYLTSYIKDTDTTVAVAKLRELSAIIVVIIFAVLIIKYLLKKRKEYKYLNSNIGTVDGMTGTEFEEYLCAHFKNLGHKVEHTGKSGDYGADLILEKDGNKIAVQAKRYSDKVGVRAVQEVISAMSYYGCNRGIIVTNSFFTANAVQMARQCGIELWDRKVIKDEFPNLL